MISFLCLFLFKWPPHLDHYTPVWVGDALVVIHQQSNGHGRSFVHVHQNETTALAAARSVIQSEGGSVLTLMHGGGRNIVFHVNNSRFECDPNRIFTKAGIKKTLQQWGKETPEAEREVARLAQAITMRLPKGKIIAVHNNETYSLKNYFPGQDMASDARAVHINQAHFYRNFYLVTKQDDYLRLKGLKSNSVWQASHARDDGSLSVLLAGASYINVEAGYDQLPVQIKMLQQA
jgi:hypothetical protein